MPGKKTKIVDVGGVKIGGGNPVSVQSMTNTKTSDIPATIDQINELTELGCDIVRISVPDSNSAKAVSKIKEKVKIPIVADVHFNWRHALEAIENGADKIRINPGNIGSKEKVKEIATAASKRKIPIRVGVNSGSIKKEFLDKFEKSSKALVESAMESVRLLESFDFDKIVISAKSSNVVDGLQAYRELAKRTDYPLHIGLTEAGTKFSGVVKSSVFIGTLLSEGIGDTIRVSLTANPADEVKAGRLILSSLGLRKFGVDLISCPTCARCEIDLISLAESVEKELSDIKKPLTVAVMGCEVNGPGEAKHADIGIAAGKTGGLLFKNGKVVRKISEEEMLGSLISEAKKLISD